MQQVYDDTMFEKENFADADLSGIEFQSCTFLNCELSGANLSGAKLHDCRFEGCNLSMANIHGTTLNDVVFSGCKALGVHFSDAHKLLFKVSFNNTNLDYAAFTARKMPKTIFAGCSLKEAGFAQCDLTGSVFNDCDLYGAIFNSTNLTSVNFVTAINFTVDPDINTIRKASFAMDSLPCLLEKHQLNIV
jgi:uncharacterized protein YjbI with pentapeptide repeats